MGDRAGSIPVIRTDKKARHKCVSFFYGADAALAPVGSRSPLRSGRCKANVRRTLCTLSSALIKSETQMCLVFLWNGHRPCPCRFKVSAPLRSVQSQRPQDVVHPVIRNDKKRDTGVSRFMKCGILKDVFLEWNS